MLFFLNNAYPETDFTFKFKKIAEFDFEVIHPEYIKNDDIYIRSIFRYKRKNASNKDENWSYLDPSSLNSFSKDQKCQFHKYIIKENPNLKISRMNCDQFIQNFIEEMKQNDYVPAEPVSVKYFVKFLSEPNKIGENFTTRGIVGEASCSIPETSRLIDQLSNEKKILPKLKKESIFKKKIDNSKVCISSREGYFKDKINKKKPEKKSYFDKFLKTSWHINDLFLIGTLYAIGEKQEIESKNSDKIEAILNEVSVGEESRSNLSLVNDYFEINNQIENEITSEMKENGQFCDNSDCLQERNKKTLERTEICDEEKKEVYEILLEKGREEYKADADKLQQFEEEMLIAKEETEEKFEVTKSAVSKAAIDRDTEDADKLVQDKNDEIIEFRAKKQEEDLAYADNLDREQKEIKEKQKNGEEITEKEKEILKEKPNTTVNYVNTETGKTDSVKEVNIREFYEQDKTANLSKSKDVKFENHVVDFSDIGEKEYSERVAVISARIVLEGQRRGESISLESATRIANVQAKKEKPIINFDILLGKKASKPVSTEEVSILKDTLERNEAKSREDLLGRAAEQEPEGSKDKEELELKVKELKKEIKQREEEIERKIKDDPSLGEVVERKKKKQYPKKKQGNISKGSTSGGATRGTNFYAGKSAHVPNRSASFSQSSSGRNSIQYQQEHQEKKQEVTQNKTSSKKEIVNKSNPSNSKSEKPKQGEQKSGKPEASYDEMMKKYKGEKGNKNNDDEESSHQVSTDNPFDKDKNTNQRRFQGSKKAKNSKVDPIKNLEQYTKDIIHNLPDERKKEIIELEEKNVIMTNENNKAVANFSSALFIESKNNALYTLVQGLRKSDNPKIFYLKSEQSSNRERFGLIKVKDLYEYRNLAGKIPGNEINQSQKNLVIESLNKIIQK